MIPHHGYRGFIGAPAAQQAGEVARVIHRRSVDFDDYVSGTKASLLGSAPLFYRPHEHTASALHPEVVTQLRGEVLDHQPAPTG